MYWLALLCLSGKSFGSAKTSMASKRSISQTKRPFISMRLNLEVQTWTPPWDALSVEQRRTLKDRIYGILRNRRATLFACAVQKQWASSQSVDAYEHAFEQVVSRFDMFLSRSNRAAIADGKEEQRGMLVLAESAFQKTLGVLARKLQTAGTRWGNQLHNVTDVPLFASPTDTRLLQFADFCSNAVYGRYQAGLTGDFDKIAPKFDQDGGVIHGLAHITTEYDCACLACFSRSARR